MSDDLFNEESDDLFDGYEQDGPGLFDEPPTQEGPDLFAEPALTVADDAPHRTTDESTTTSIPESEDPAVAELAAPASTRRERPVDQAPAAPLALYRRYRPDTFADVIGQEHVTEPLQRALVNNRVNHAYLFSGPRGCGKTTSARILARCLNCEQGPTPTPCGVCQSCRDLARGGTGSIDVIEIDAASHGGVDDARDLRERAFFAPVHSRYKIYIIDEAHMVTAAGFNALLKLVEEPPPHVKFIFATTEPEKVIGTIRSRTHHYPFRLVPPKVLTGYLGELCEKEGVHVEAAVLPLVVRAGAGSVRDSLSVLDQLLGGASADGVGYEHASALLGYTPDSLLDRIVDAFAAGDSTEVFATIDAVIEQGQDPRRFAEDLLRRLRDLVVVAAVDDAISSGLVDVAADQAERLQVQAAGLGLGELTRAAEVISQGLTDMRGTTAPRLHLELMCARVLLPGADVDDRGVHARLDRLERRLGMGDPNAPVEPVPSPTWDLGEADDATPTTRPGESARDAVRRQASEAAGRQAPAGQSAPSVPARQDAPQQADVRPHPSDGPAPHGPDERPAQEPRGVVEPDIAAAAQRRPAGPEVAPSTRAEQGSHPSQAEPVRGNSPVADEPATSPAVPAPSNRLSVADVRRMWPTILEQVKERRRFTWILLSQNAQVLDVQGNVLTLGLNNPGARESWERGGNGDVLADVLIDVVGTQLRIDAILDDGARPAGQGADHGPAGSAGSEPSGAAPADRRTAPAAGRPDPATERPAPPPPPAEVLQAARDNIRPTRERPAAEDEPEEEPEFSRDDPDADVAPMSSDELLRDVLGARRLPDEP